MLQANALETSSRFEKYFSRREKRNITETATFLTATITTTIITLTQKPTDLTKHVRARQPLATIILRQGRIVIHMVTATTPPLPNRHVRTRIKSRPSPNDALGPLKPPSRTTNGHGWAEYDQPPDGHQP